MGENKEIMKKIFDACQKKDYDVLRELVDENYTLQDPLMPLKGLDALIEMLEACPSGGAENLQIIADGDTVVSTMDATMPGQKPMRMCSVATVKEGKLIAEEMFYDTAQIPQEMRDIMSKGKAEGATGASAQH